VQRTTGPFWLGEPVFNRTMLANPPILLAFGDGASPLGHGLKI
jgi:hypothetical protein